MMNLEPPMAPSGLRDFATNDAEQPQPNRPIIRFGLCCQNCGHEYFSLQEVLAGEYGVGGIEATCDNCGRVGSVFHASRDGYDGSLGHLLFLEAVSGRQPLKDDDQREIGNTQVAAGFCYSIELNELAAIAEEEHLAPQDLFDWVVVYARNSDQNAWREVWEYECA
jgi:hypothetical protein